MQCGYNTVHKQMSEKHIFSLLPFFFRPLFPFLFFFLSSLLICIVSFVISFVFFLLLPSFKIN